MAKKEELLAPTANKADRQKAFTEALKTVSENFKNEKVSLLKDYTNSNAATISTGSLVLDSILGGGVAKGRIIEIYGAEASGKTSIAMTILGKIQKDGGNCVLIDCEQASDFHYYSTLGVDIDKLGFSQAIIAEDVLKMALDLCESGTVDAIVIDSIAAMIPRDEFTQDSFDKASIGLVARLLSKALRRIAVAANNNNCTVILINQTRSNIGVMYGPSTTTTGGNATKFYASQRIEIKKKGKVEEGGEVVGNELFMKCVKNKINRPYLEGISILSFENGINTAAEILTVGEKVGVIEKEGRTYYCNIDPSVDISGGMATRVEPDGARVKIGVNTAPVMEEIRTNKKIFDVLYKLVFNALNKKTSDYSKDSLTEEKDEN